MNDPYMCQLVKYRDAGMSTYTYFWIDPRGQIASPYFDDEYAAKEWLDEQSRAEGSAF